MHKDSLRTNIRITIIMNLDNLSLTELCNLKYAVEKEIELRRVRELSEFTTKGMSIFRKIWRLVDNYGTFEFTRITKNNISFKFTPKIKIKEDINSTFNIYIEKWMWEKNDGEGYGESYHLHIDLGGWYVFNYLSKNSEKMGPHNQFRNDKAFPNELMEIDVIRELMSIPQCIFNKYLEYSKEYDDSNTIKSTTTTSN